MKRRGREKEEVALKRQCCIRMCGSESVRLSLLCESGQSLTCERVRLERSVYVKSLKTQPSPISLQLKFYEGSSDEKVFGMISRCDVNMSGRSGL